MAKTKTDFVIALTQLAAERNLPKEIVLRAIETALVSIFKKNSFGPDQEISVKIVPQTGEVKVYAQKVVVEKPADARQEVSLSEARKLKTNVQVGEMIEVESTPENAGRIAAQAAKQVILQRLKEAERDAIFGEYANKEGGIVSGAVRYVEPRQIVVDLGKAEAILPLAEQISTEHYRIGQRLKFYLLKVVRTNKGTQLIVSRTHQNLVRRLFELETPEIYNGTVELKAIAREPGYRSKVAVAARQEGVDAVGCCVGLRSVRIQNITKELNGERVDIVQWHHDPAVFITNALSPASVVKVEINEAERSAIVVVPDKQLSLAIGKGGQNARLAAKLSGWRIDIKNLSISEVEEKATQVEEAAPSEVMPVVETITEVMLEPQAEEITPIPVEIVEPALTSAEVLPAPEPEVETPVVAEPVPPPKTYSVEEILSEIETATESLQVRFGEETPINKGVKSEDKAKKIKVKSAPKDEIPERKTKPKKPPRWQHARLEEEGDED